MAEKLTDIELSDIQLHDTKARSLARDPANVIVQEDDIETALGIIHVAVQGDRRKPAIVTYHDIGLNHMTCFQGFFNYSDMQPILQHFCVYHINAPGQCEGSVPLPNGGTFSTNEIKPDLYQYPTMDQLAEMILPILQYYGIKRAIGFGVGAGANILSRFALSHPEKIDALVLINCSASQAGWVEWGYQKVNSWYLRGGNMTAFTEDYLLWHWFGKVTQDYNHDLVKVYQDAIKAINPHNLAMFIESYIKRTDLGIVRETLPDRKSSTKMLQCPVMLVTGDGSPHIDDTVNMNSRLDPTNSNWFKVSECGGMVLEEQPSKVCEAFRLFLQGMGYVVSLRKPTSSTSSISPKLSPTSTASSESLPGGLPGVQEVVQEVQC